ncbi:hypothetical protein ABVF61_31170 [Roseibium sp. HPY-6]|uniref:hypothetical protein n=1 Tax=Roseibium sp. HPY-6 TaxID=3229852 RepID=UPI003390134E
MNTAFHQDRAGLFIKFSAISPGETVLAVRAEAKVLEAFLSQISVERGTLEERLMRENHDPWE